MNIKKSYFQGGGEENEPTPKKKKYKDEPINQDLTKSRGLFFKNFDLYDVGNPKTSPGTGFYSKMNEYESIADFRKKKNKRALKLRNAIFQTILGNLNKYSEDKNNLTDPTEDTITPIPWSPAEISPLGLLDGIYPKEDLDGNSPGNLYYGMTEMRAVEAKKK